MYLLSVLHELNRLVPLVSPAGTPYNGGYQIHVKDNVMKSDKAKLLELTLDIGRALLENGAETYRVEESISRIMTAYGVSKTEVFAIPACIITSISDDAENLTKVERITQRSTNLDRVTRLSNLSRLICETKPDMHTIRMELDRIMAQPTYPFFLQMAAFMLVASAFTVVLGGDIRAGLAAALCGLCTKPVIDLLVRFQTNIFFTNIIGGALIAAIALVAARFGLSSQVDLIIIGTLMNLVPGVAITNSMRDIIAGDFVSGLTKLTEAVIIAVAIALGTGLTFTVVNHLL